jgi:hypothetical protein
MRGGDTETTLLVIQALLADAVYGCPLEAPTFTAIVERSDLPAPRPGWRAGEGSCVTTFAEL